jgi:hypothetical protein
MTQLAQTSQSQPTMAKSSFSKAPLPGNIEPSATTIESIPPELYDIIIKLAISATPTSVHTIKVACTNKSETLLVADVDKMEKLLLINHRFKKTITRMIFDNCTKNTTQITTKAVIDKLIESRVYPPFQEEAHNLEIAVEILKQFAYPKLSGCFQAGNTVSQCYPNIKSIKTSLSHESDALFGMRPDISTCTEESKRSYIARMVTRMLEGNRSYISSFIFGMTEYERMVNLECWYRERETSNLVRNMFSY